MNKNVNMLSGSITKGLLSMTMPIMIMNVMQSLFSIVDMSVLKHFSNDTSVGAVGASGMLIALCTSLLIGISAGTNVVVARGIGLGKKERVNRAVTTAILFSIAGGITLMIIGSLYAGTFLEWTNCPESLLGSATVYFRIYFYSVPFSMLYNFCSAILRAMGDTKRPMYFLIIGGIIKIIFTILFVAEFSMSVAGVAIATIISNLVISILAFIALLKNEYLHINFKKMRFFIPELKEMLFIGIPSGLQAGMYSLANVVITATVNNFGADATTGVSIANQFDGIMYQIIYAPSLATTPYVSQNIGAGNIERVRKTVSKSILTTSAFGLTFGLLSAAFSKELSLIMSESSTVIAYSQQKMVLVSSTYFLFGISEIMGGVLKGMDKPIIPTITTFLYTCVLRFVWVYVIFPLCPPNLTFLYLVWPIGWLLSIITLIIIYFPVIKKLQINIERRKSPVAVS